MTASQKFATELSLIAGAALVGFSAWIFFAWPKFHEPALHAELRWIELATERAGRPNNGNDSGTSGKTDFSNLKAGQHIIISKRPNSDWEVSKVNEHELDLLARGITGDDCVTLSSLVVRGLANGHVGRVNIEDESGKSLAFFSKRRSDGPRAIYDDNAIAAGCKLESARVMHMSFYLGEGPHDLSQ